MSTYSYKICKYIVKEGTSGEEKTASWTQIMEKEKFLFLCKLKQNSVSLSAVVSIFFCHPITIIN